MFTVHVNQYGIWKFFYKKSWRFFINHRSPTNKAYSWRRVFKTIYKRYLVPIRFFKSFVCFPEVWGQLKLTWRQRCSVLQTNFNIDTSWSKPEIQPQGRNSRIPKIRSFCAFFKHLRVKPDLWWAKLNKWYQEGKKQQKTRKITSEYCSIRFRQLRCG